MTPPPPKQGDEDCVTDIFTPSTSLGVVYQKYCIEINRAFAMTSVMCTLERPEGQGARTYKIKGPVTHL